MRKITYIWPVLSCYQIMQFEGVDDPLSSKGTVPFLPSATWRGQTFAVVRTLGKNIPCSQSPTPLKMV